MPVEYTRNEQGRYQTDGLSAKDFHRVFELIQKQQRKNRRKARRTLTPRTMGKRNRELDAFFNLGKKKDGTYFTPEDIRNFDAARKTHKSKFRNTVPGITYAQLVAQSTSIDIKRANNRVSDGTGIKAATFLGIKHNLAVVSVKASDESVHQHHRVRIRFEEWDQAVEDMGEDGANKARIAADLCKGRVSFDCDCGRHQYWYRYMATAGNYAVAPPKEYAFPKIRNPDLTGVACKHVLHTMTRFQSSTWHRAIINSLEKAAKQVAFGDDKRKTTTFFKGEIAKALARNRTTTTDQAKVAREFERYQKAQDALDKKLKSPSQATDKVRRLLKKARTKANKKEAELQAAKAREEQARKEATALKKTLQAQADNLIKFFMSQGMDKAAATAQAKAILQTQINEARKRKG
ncbi:phage tail protein [Salmonella enterica subsp. enterica serovar Carrau]